MGGPTVAGQVGVLTAGCDTDLSTSQCFLPYRPHAGGKVFPR